MPRDVMLPHSIRFTADEWAVFTAAAVEQHHGQVTSYVRDCAIAGHSFLAAQQRIQVTGVTRRVTSRGRIVPQFRAG